MYKIEELTKEDYDLFLNTFGSISFMQSSTWALFENIIGIWTPHYLGIRENNKVIMASLFLEKKLSFGYSFYYAQRGIIINDKDKKLLSDYTLALKSYAKSKRVLFIKINPEIKLQSIDLEGKKIDNTEDNFELVKYLKSLGYKHRGYNKKFDHSEPRFTFRLNLETDIFTIENNFHETTKKIIKRGNIYALEIVKNNNTNIDDFYLTMLETAKRENILYQNLHYYKSFYEILHKNNMSDLYTIKANIGKIKNILTESIDDLKNKIKELNEKEDNKNINKKQEFINQLSKKNKLLEEVNTIKEESLVLSSILTAKYKDTVWTVYGGNHSLLRELNANYFIYYEIIKDAKQENFKNLDFFGTTYNPPQNDSEFGIHLFKRRLGGEYTEYIGEFDLIIHPILYKIFTKLIPLYRKLKTRNLKVKGDSNETN